MEFNYVITSAYDGNAPHWEQRYDKAYGAWENFFLFIDHGMANEYRTVTLTTTDGEVSKTFHRDGRIEVSA
jgi:hypothetical protein